MLLFTAYNNHIKKIIKAEIISEEPIIGRVSEKTGHTNSYGRYYSYHEHYRYRDAITGYNVKFAVEFIDGKKGTKICKKDGFTYNKLIKKIK